MDFLQRQADFALGPLVVPLLLGIATLALIIWHSSRKHRYWDEIGIPYVKPYPFFGSVLDYVKQPLHHTDQERYNKYGRIHGHYEGNSPLLSVAEPELLRQILVKDFHAFTGRRSIATGDKVVESMISNLRGEDWKRVRTIVTPTFTTGKIKRMMSIFKDCSRSLVQNFRDANQKGKPINAKELYGAFSMDIIASAAFSTKIDSHNDPNNEFVATARNVLTGRPNYKFLIFLLVPWLMKLFRARLFPPKFVDFFSAATLQIIEERKRTGQKRNDFLQLLLDTEEELFQEGKLDLNEKDDITENYGKDESGEIFKPTALKKKTLSREELIGNCVIFFLAGYETTASTLSFASYLLALNPEAQEKLIEELDNALRQNNGELTYEAVQGMKYLDNVISETMRLYPPASRLERVADEDYKLGDTGLTIPKGMMVSVPVYAIHRDPEFFPDPEKFDPDRFTPEERSKRNQYSYLPFGAGPRNCVGMRFALMEVKVCLAHVLSNFRFRRCPETKVPLNWNLSSSLLKPKNIILQLELRKDAVKAM